MSYNFTSGTNATRERKQGSKFYKLFETFGRQILSMDAYEGRRNETSSASLKKIELIPRKTRGFSTNLILSFTRSDRNPSIACASRPQAQKTWKVWRLNVRKKYLNKKNKNNLNNAIIYFLSRQGHRKLNATATIILDENIKD
jgi:hypothetical protein